MPPEDNEEEERFAEPCEDPNCAGTIEDWDGGWFCSHCGREYESTKSEEQK